jgi:hypothetical protein
MSALHRIVRETRSDWLQHRVTALIADYTQHMKLVSEATRPAVKPVGGVAGGGCNCAGDDGEPCGIRKNGCAKGYKPSCAGEGPDCECVCKQKRDEL